MGNPANSRLKPIAKNPFWQEKITQLEAIKERADSLFSEAVQCLQHMRSVQTTNHLLGASPNSTSTADSILQCLLYAQRLILIDKCGLSNNTEAIQYLCETSEPSWVRAEALPVSDDLQKRLAQRFLSSPAPAKNPRIQLIATSSAKGVLAHMLPDYLRRGVMFDVLFQDYEFMTRLSERATIDGLTAAGEYLTGLFANDRIDKINIVASQADTALSAREDKPKIDALKSWMPKGYRRRATTEDMVYTLTRIPTRADAEKDGIPYKEYIELFFQMCDQPWDRIQTAQDHLIGQLDAGKILHITNDDGTDLTIDITGQTFANSVIAKNIPGAEVFSAPLINGVNGKLVAKGRFIYNNKYMEDLAIEFKDGEVVSAKARVGDEHFQEILSKPGAKRVGEIAFGTNPWLKRHVVNGLLVEKIGGSFHIALGACYKYTEYLGKPVRLTNGNESEVHWDITTMLTGKSGKVFLDGALIQDNGLYTDPKLAVLNLGWGAVPKSKIPAAWKKILDRQRVA